MTSGFRLNLAAEKPQHRVMGRRMRVWHVFPEPLPLRSLGRLAIFPPAKVRLHQASLCSELTPSLNNSFSFTFTGVVMVPLLLA